MILPERNYIDGIFNKCHNDGYIHIWFVSDIVIVVMGVLANIALLWLLLRDRKSMSTSKVLGLNLVAMDLVYLSILPFSVIHEAQHAMERSKMNNSDMQQSNSTYPFEEARDIFSMFSLVGCPLLLTCMCIERYLAVVRPVLYLRVRKLEYRMAISAVVWVITLFFCVATFLAQDIIIMPVSIIISCLFFLMLGCLGGVVWSLLQQSPAHTACSHKARSESPLKRRAVNNVLVVLVPAVIAYLPVLSVIPLVLYIYCCTKSLNKIICYILELSLSFPKFGVLIGPLFYFSKAKQLCCLNEPDKTCNE